jgi:hypothetical protein
MYNTSIVPTKIILNSKTLNGGASPIPISKYPVQENIINLDGWYHITTYKGGICWSIYPIGTNATTKLKLSNLNQIYYTVNFNKPTPYHLIPQLYINWGVTSYSTFFPPTTGVTYPLPAGTYTFVLNFNSLVSNSNIVNANYNNTTGRIINLSFNAAYSNPTSVPLTLTNTINNVQLTTQITSGLISNENFTIAASAGTMRYSTNAITYTNTTSAVNIQSIKGINAFIVSNSIMWMAYGSFTGTGTTACIAYSSSSSSTIPSGTFVNVPSIFAGTSVVGSINSVESNNAYNSANASAADFMILAGGFITSGGSGNVPLAYSVTGSSWTQFTTANSPILVADTVNTICYSYNSNRWLIGLNSRTGGTLVTAINSGTTFTFTADNVGSGILNTYIISIASNLTNDLLVAVGKGSSNNNQIMISSGATAGNVGSWTVVNANLFTDTSAVKHNGTLWLIGGSGTNSLAYSLITALTPTGSWIGLSKNTTTNPFNTVNKIEWSGTTWVACGTAISGNVFAYSYSGTTWSTISSPTNITGLGSLYPQVYQFLLSNLYLENSRDTNISPGTIQYYFDSNDVDNNYQYNIMNTLIQNLYKMDLYTYSDPLTITTL